MLYLLNSIVPPDLLAGEYVRVDMAHVGSLATTSKLLAKLLEQREHISAIGHQPTAALLGVPATRRRVALRYGDTAVAVRLAARGGERPVGDQAVDPRDLEVWVYRVGEALPTARGRALLLCLLAEEEE